VRIHDRDTASRMRRAALFLFALPRTPVLPRPFHRELPLFLDVRFLLLRAAGPSLFLPSIAYPTSTGSYMTCGCVGALPGYYLPTTTTTFEMAEERAIRAALPATAPRAHRYWSTCYSLHTLTLYRASLLLYRLLCGARCAIHTHCATGGVPPTRFHYVDAFTTH